MIFFCGRESKGPLMRLHSLRESINQDIERLQAQKMGRVGKRGHFPAHGYRNHAQHR